VKEMKWTSVVRQGWVCIGLLRSGWARYGMVWFTKGLARCLPLPFLVLAIFNQMAKTKQKVTAVSEPTNGGKNIIDISKPYTVEATISGVSDLLFHRWNTEAIAAKAEGAKGSKARKTDDVESFVYRDEKGVLCLPSEYIRMALVNAAKFQQDPRSPRKSAMDLFKSAIFPLNKMCSLGVKDWDFLDKRRVCVNRAGITRSRPALREGWKCTVLLQVNLPEYIDDKLLLATLNDAGRLVGVGDFRPTYGRFQVTSFKVL